MDIRNLIKYYYFINYLIDVCIAAIKGLLTALQEPDSPWLGVLWWAGMCIYLMYPIVCGLRFNISPYFLQLRTYYLQLVLGGEPTSNRSNPPAELLSPVFFPRLFYLSCRYFSWFQIQRVIIPHLHSALRSSSSTHALPKLSQIMCCYLEWDGLVQSINYVQSVLTKVKNDLFQLLDQIEHKLGFAPAVYDVWWYEGTWIKATQSGSHSDLLGRIDKQSSEIWSEGQIMETDPSHLAHGLTAIVVKLRRCKSYFLLFGRPL